MVLLHPSVRLMLIHGHAWINTQSNTQEDAPAHLSFSLASCILCNTECTLTFFAQLLELIVEEQVICKCYGGENTEA